MLLTAGDFSKGHFNTMTVAWGSFGTMWGKPFAQVVVRPTRYTYEFMEQYDSFTLCAFAEEDRDVLNLLGSQSGRAGDKITAAGITPVPSRCVASPGFDEAELIIECIKTYYTDMNPDHFLDNDIMRHYQDQDYHRIYFGEIKTISGTSAYSCSCRQQ